MKKTDAYKIGVHSLEIYSRLPYKLECKLEELIFKIREGMEGEPSNFDLKGFSISKKISINDFLLINAILSPKITELDLDNDEHILNNDFREIGDYLSDKYIAQYTEKRLEKKKLMKSPLSQQEVPEGTGQ